MAEQENNKSFKKENDLENEKKWSLMDLAITLYLWSKDKHRES